MSDMSKESAPSGGDPLEIVPDLTEGDDAAPGDEAGLSDESGSSAGASGPEAVEEADPDGAPDQPNPGGTPPSQLAGTSGSDSASDPMPDIAGTSS
jgi:hypothetical protein